MTKIDWKPIETVPKDETVVLIGQYMKDTFNGYYGESRWIWITQGSFDEAGNFFDSFNDDDIPAEHMIFARQPTHWAHVPKGEPL